MKSIIFNTEMVKAVLDGRKTQFRIAMKDCDTFDIEETENGFNLIHNYKMRIENVGLFSSKELLINWFQSKYSKYKVDDILYVKETFNLLGEDWGIANPLNIEYRADNTKSNHKWFSSNSMRLDYSRIFLKVTNVRVERLQDISLEDMLKEGINHKKSYNYGDIVKTYTQIKREFINSWNSKAKDGYKWEDNPYVFVYEFERINKED